MTTYINPENIISHIRVERALEDMRRGLPVIYSTCSGNYVVFAVETMSEELYKLLVNSNKGYLLLSKYRVKALSGLKKPASLAIDKDTDIKLIKHLSAIEFNNYIKIPNLESYKMISLAEEKILNLIKSAEILPAAIIFDLEQLQDDNDLLKKLEILKISENDFNFYSNNLSLPIKEILEAPLVLRGETKAKIKAFRSQIGGREHYAILIGNPLKDTTPLVRVHSSCYTGDLLQSMACDCHDQLISAVDIMSNFAINDDKEFSGGIIIYLLQEGRGIGLTSKLRAYNLQAKGLDTVEANNHLGLDDETRLFAPAANILHELKISTITLLTNNPIKAEQLEEYKINIAATMPHFTNPNDYNRAYLETKTRKMGHKIVL